MKRLVLVGGPGDGRRVELEAGEDQISIPDSLPAPGMRMTDAIREKAIRMHVYTRSTIHTGGPAFDFMRYEELTHAQAVERLIQQYHPSDELIEVQNHYYNVPPPRG